MKQRVLSVMTLAVLAAVVMTGCSHEHTFSPATCTAPATCTECGETEGEVLPHTMSEANYQQPATCSVCGVTEGDVLTPDFVEHGVKGTFMELGKTYDYVTTCYQDKSKKTVGQATVTRYETIPSDDTHEAKEGYEWKIVEIQASFSDENAWYYGIIPGWHAVDYYELGGFGNQTEETFTLNWNGQDYTECDQWVKGDWGDWEDYTIVYTVQYDVLVPIGYDGRCFGIHDGSVEWGGMYLYDVADENTLFFRLQ